MTTSLITAYIVLFGVYCLLSILNVIAIVTSLLEEDYWCLWFAEANLIPYLILFLPGRLLDISGCEMVGFYLQLACFIVMIIILTIFLIFAIINLVSKIKERKKEKINKI